MTYSYGHSKKRYPLTDVANYQSQFFGSLQVSMKLIEQLQVEHLEPFLPKLWDKHAVKDFVAEELSKNMLKSKGKKRNLVETLRERLGIEKRANDETTKAADCSSISKTKSKNMARPCNKNARKKTRQVEMKWVHEGKDITRKQGGGKDITRKQGGGLRKLAVNTDCNKAELIEIGKNLFFPHGSSQMGHVSAFTFEMGDTSRGDMEEDETVAKLYELTKFSILPLVMTTNRKKDVVEKQGKFETVENDSMPPQSVSEESKCEGTDNDTTPPLSDNSEESIVFSMFASSNEQTTCTSPADDTDPVIQTVIEQSVPYFEGNTFDSEVIFSGADTNTDCLSQIDTTLPITTLILRLHRGHVMEELENFFMYNDFEMRQQNLQIQMVLPNGETELGEDNGGILRDCLTEYWDTFYMKRTLGHTLKVPALTHSVDGKRWEAVGKIMLVGYYYEKYFPTQIASCFLDYTADGDIVPKDLLLQQYLKFLPEIDSKLVANALDDFENVDQGDLIDFLDDHKVQLLPNKMNLKTILEDLAHKEMIQSPTYVAHSIRPYILELKAIMAVSFTEMNQMKPKFKGIWQSLKLEEQSDVVGYFKMYLKELTEVEMRHFLRFCTGM